MEDKGGVLFHGCFSEMKDPRRKTKGNFRHDLMDMIFLVVSAVVSGANDWQHIEEFGEQQIDWLRKFAKFKNGVPSHDTLGRVFSVIDFDELSTCFTEWTNTISDMTEGEVVAIDGKTLCGSYKEKKGESTIHMVSAFACQNGVSLGQVTTDEKSNEITAIPKLLELLSIKGCIVTIDAMGCQKTIATDIKGAGADYVLAVKENQPTLMEQTKKMFDIGNIKDRHEDVDSGHGRIEKRICSIIDDFTFFDAEKWEGLKCLVKIETEAFTKKSGKTNSEVRYYISSCSVGAKRMNEIIREHWRVENNLHWVLDVVFDEDSKRRRNGNSPQNFNVFTKMAMSFLDKAEVKKQTSLSRKRYRAAMSIEFREEVLNL